MPLPDVVNALVSIATSNAPTGVLVYDGEPAQDPAIGETIIVIGSGLEQATTSDESLGNLTQWDTYDLIGYVRHTSGDTGLADDRNAAYAAFLTFRLGVQRSPTLQGAIVGGGWARLADWEFQPTDEADLDADAVGTYAQINFRISVNDLVRAT